MTNRLIGKNLLLYLAAIGFLVFFQNCSTHFDIESKSHIATWSTANLSSHGSGEVTLKKTSASLLFLQNPRIVKEVLLNSEWNRIKNQFRTFVRSSINNTSVIYDAQLEMASFVQYAYEHNKKNWLYDLMSIYLEAYPALQVKSEYTFYYPKLPNGSSPPRVAMALTQSYRMWLDGPEESVLNSSQFLYPITLFLYWIEKNGAYDKDPVAKEFFDKYVNVAITHYRRWVLKEGSQHGVFQVQGWGCNPGTFSHLEYLTHLKARHFGTSYFSSFHNYGYCNAVIDTDLFILAGVMHILAAQRLNPSRYNLSINAVSDLNQYLILGTELFQSRIHRQSSINFQGQSVPVVNFDLGAWDDYPDFAYSGDTNATFPGWDTLGATPHRGSLLARNTGWDISHARRMVLFLFSLREFGVNQNLISSSSLSEIEIGMTNQLAYQVFNRNFESPAFSNFFDGTNGWYRVNYSDRPTFGYEPSSWDLGSSIFLGGYGFWARHNSDLEKVLLAGEKRMKYRSNWTYTYCLQTYSAMPDSFFAGGKRRPSNTGNSICPNIP